LVDTLSFNMRFSGIAALLFSSFVYAQSWYPWSLCHHNYYH
jgi:hypothetical protein